MGRSRNDQVDARTLAELLRLNAAEGVYHGESGTRTLRHLLRAYECPVKDISRVRNRPKALFNSEAVKRRGRELCHPSRRQDRIAQLPNEGQRTRAELSFKRPDALKALKRAARAAMVTGSRRHPARRVPGQAPGLGPVRIAQVIATVETPPASARSARSGSTWGWRPRRGRAPTTRWSKARCGGGRRRRRRAG